MVIVAFQAFRSFPVVHIAHPLFHNICAENSVVFFVELFDNFSDLGMAVAVFSAKVVYRWAHAAVESPQVPMREQPVPPAIPKEALGISLVIPKSGKRSTDHINSSVRIAVVGFGLETNIHSFDQCIFSSLR